MSRSKSRSKSQSHAAIIFAVLVGILAVKSTGIVGTQAADRVSPIGGLFNFRRDRDKDRRSKSAEEPQSTGIPLPPGVPIAPPAQYQGLGPLTNAPEDPVLRRVEEAIRITTRRFLNAEPIGENAQHTPWQIMHGILALRHDLELKSRRGMVNAIEWISHDPVYRGEHWFEATRYGGRAHPFSIPYYFEGHVNQFLALLTMANLPLDHQFQVAGGKTVAMSDMVRHAQMGVNANEEISWTLWFLTHYLEPDATWVNAQGQRWGMETLVRLQVDDEITTAPCGGSHGLFALSYARNSYLQKHGKLTGSWVLADLKIQKAIEAVRTMQNKDGSYSSKFLREPGFSQDASERLRASGHTLEWLMMAVRQPQLSEQWLRAGVYSVANDLIRFSNQPIDPGILFHSLHSLVLYRERVAAPRSLSPTEAKPLLADATPKAGSGAPAATQERPQATPPMPEPKVTLRPIPTPKNEPAAETQGEKPSAPPMPEVKPEETARTETPAPMPEPVASPTVTANAPPTKNAGTAATTPSEKTAVAVPMPEATTPETTTPSEKPEPAPSVAETGTPKLPELPTLPAPKDGQLEAMLPQRAPVKTPGPDDRPIEPSLAADPPPPPPLIIVQRSTEGLSKPTGAATKAPPPPVIHDPVSLPPMYLDPVDMPAPKSGK